MKIEYVTDIDLLREVGSHWLAEHRGKEYGFDVTVDTIIADTKAWLESGNGAVIALVDEKAGYVGFMSIFCMCDFLGLKAVAFEKYWYVMPGYRAGGLLMVNEAKRWAKERGAAHLIMSASVMASGMYDTLCLLYERVGMMPFEKSYICEL